MLLNKNHLVRFGQISPSKDHYKKYFSIAILEGYKDLDVIMQKKALINMRIRFVSLIVYYTSIFIDMVEFVWEFNSAKL